MKRGVKKNKLLQPLFKNSAPIWSQNRKVGHLHWRGLKKHTCLLFFFSSLFFLSHLNLLLFFYIPIFLLLILIHNIHLFSFSSNTYSSNSLSLLSSFETVSVNGHLLKSSVKPLLLFDTTATVVIGVLL